jgi:hypothetical protein
MSMKNTRPTRERNLSIVRLSWEGKSAKEIAARFKVTRGRVRTIIATYDKLQKRRSRLKVRYGECPNIAQLPDHTPADVLILCNTDIHGWDVRVKHLAGAVKTLGELRRMTDQELFSMPQIGQKMFAQLRTFCPFRSTGQID